MKIRRGVKLPKANPSALPPGTVLDKNGKPLTMSEVGAVLASWLATPIVLVYSCVAFFAYPSTDTKDSQRGDAKLPLPLALDIAVHYSYSPRQLHIALPSLPCVTFIVRVACVCAVLQFP